MLKPIEEKDLRLILNWRNKSYIRNNMINNQIISWEEHYKWFEKLENRKDQEVLIFILNGQKMGLVSFTNIDFENKHCSWGFYIGEEMAPKGAGTFMAYNALNYAFYKYSFHKINSQVLSFNAASLRYHEKLGFDKSGILKDEILRDGTFCDLILFSLFNKHWNEKKESIYQETMQKMTNILINKEVGDCVV